MKRLTFILSFVLLIGSALAAEPASVDSVSAFGKYPLTICPVCGETDVSSTHTKVYDGREVVFCGDDCISQFEKNLAESMMSLNMHIAEAQRPTYAMTSCIVCGDGMDPKAEAIESVYLNQYVKFCCRECLASFNKNPETYTGNLTAAMNASAGEKKE